VFLIMFKTGHALPLAGARLLRPRMSRDEHAEHPRKVSGAWPQTRQILDRDSVGEGMCPRTVHVREQSVSAFIPRKQARPRTDRVFGNAAASTVRKPAAATNSNWPQTTRKRELSTSAKLQSAKTVREHEQAKNCPRRCIAVAILPPIHFPVPIHINPAYVFV
jgi:hypothetical protein